ncbi:ABC transporter permease [Bacteroides sp.]|uniref:ABC transporter permease n=1 Tax=Bacteroides sp. TaxID=29523 RepID=UPI0025BBBA9F|nr:ABC transporter permease [Bacteroides sp.]
MNKKLFTQIKNEWHSNLWIATELLLVSVVMWYVVDYIYVQYRVYNEPHGFDISHCYLVNMGQLTDKSPDFIPNDTLIADEIEELVNRIARRPEVEAVSLSQNSYPYNGSNSGSDIRYDTLQSYGYVVRRLVTPDFLRVFRYEGTRGETPEQLAEMLTKENFLASDNLYERKYNIKLTSLVGKQFYLWGDTTKTYNLAASLKPIRYSDHDQALFSYCMLYQLSRSWYDTHLEVCIRVKENQDVDFINRLKADSEKQLRVGNVFIADIRSFADIRRNFEQNSMNELRNYVFGMVFLLLNIFLGLLGTFWFRTQQRRSEIALHKALGGTNRTIFNRLLTEGLLLLVIATVPAIVIDWNLAHAELNSWMNGTTLETGRFIITTILTFILITLMIVTGIGIPARKAMKIQPAEALREE